ncbi:hypothetical protein TNIN_302521 [Trichonephila inaurata madagascariensis]|uniref:Uncharacterized protein n=1 Tax=Trichonephila inaurata madagascariensis TaxID=2747483 RepID=A0A8X6IFG2_9ARAC|nr:hypothetical protein TNIN_302521 [Trichonephila inaurata madagascariensis]
MDLIAELRWLHGREDFSGIDNEALDFTDLEDYLNNDGDKNGRIMHLVIVLVLHKISLRNIIMVVSTQPAYLNPMEHLLSEVERDIQHLDS